MPVVVSAPQVSRFGIKNFVQKASHMEKERLAEEKKVSELHGFWSSASVLPGGDECEAAVGDERGAALGLRCLFYEGEMLILD